MLGPCEHAATELYRSFFVDLDDFAAQLKVWISEPIRILEVGCGEGALAERLVRVYPGAFITAIDISSKVGRLFRGDKSRVAFLNQPIERLVAETPRVFDLVVLCDVLHHVAVAHRRGLFSSIRRAMAPRGCFALKDWEPSFGLVHPICFLSDRFVTGDRVCFWTREEMKACLEEVFGSECIRAEARIRPRWNNIAFLVRPRTDREADDG